ncbi:RxLR effector protein [Phytophthora megakarya]|uniref:RxLR effector protein n=1 Tax=Phytophthora megakarya TaxID=4795 RepID=A0A225W5N6_9STRA|nr:RxLR effector protein [Phytophthora megakarya]
MHLSSFGQAMAVTLLFTITAISPNNAISVPQSKALYTLPGGHNHDGRVQRSHETFDSENDGAGEERGGGINNFLNKFRYQSHGAEGAESFNPITMARIYLQENPSLFNVIRSDTDKRYETFLIWRSMKYHSDDVGRAMLLNGYSAKEVKKFVKEFKAFKPANLEY